MHNYELPATFYLGRPIDSEGKAIPEPLLYDAKDLCTHALIVGMTGSGKTGLGVGLLEEAAIDGIPSIVIDPKGDMANLMLQFPELSPKDFEPWVDEAKPRARGKTVAEFAAGTAAMWEKGLADWGSSKERIQKLKDSAEFTVYTPGSHHRAPPARAAFVRRAAGFDPREDAEEALGDRGNPAWRACSPWWVSTPTPAKPRIDPVVEHPARRLERRPQHGSRASHHPRPGTRPSSASASWTSSPSSRRRKALQAGDDPQQRARLPRLRRVDGRRAARPCKTSCTPKRGKPRVSILSIAHLSDARRMFFVSILLGEVVAWMRTQPGLEPARPALHGRDLQLLPPPRNRRRSR
ncbi:MAG: DUF87 domain-containing protein [Planctomycetota bacterium]